MNFGFKHGVDPTLAHSPFGSVFFNGTPFVGVVRGRSKGNPAHFWHEVPLYKSIKATPMKPVPSPSPTNFRGEPRKDGQLDFVVGFTPSSERLKACALSHLAAVRPLDAESWLAVGPCFQQGRKHMKAPGYARRLVWLVPSKPTPRTPNTMGLVR